jgi:hypothetical protein
MLYTTIEREWTLRRAGEIRKIRRMWSISSQRDAYRSILLGASTYLTAFGDS